MLPILLIGNIIEMKPIYEKYSVFKYIMAGYIMSVKRNLLKTTLNPFDELINSDAGKLYGLESILANIAVKLINYRKSNNLNQKQLAEKLQVSQSMVSKLESGMYNPTVEQLWKLSKKLGWEFDVLFEKELIEEGICNKEEHIEMTFYNKELNEVFGKYGENITEIKKLLSDFRLLRSRVAEFSIETKHIDMYSITAKLEYDLKHNIINIMQVEDNFTGNLEFTVNIKAKVKNSILFKIKFKIEGFFSGNSKELDEEGFKSMIEQNGVAILYELSRSFIMSTTELSGLNPPVKIPLIEMKN